MSTLLFRTLGLVDYQTVWDDMRAFTATRTLETIDEIWFVEHPAVFTEGQASKAEHLINPGTIPVIKTDRGGQVTYHGPGQLVVYFLLNLRRLGFNVRTLVTTIEQTVVDLLSHWAITAFAKPNAPGVYVENAKIASLGLRIRQGYTYHGLSLNVNMDLGPFALINPCGFKDLSMTHIAQFVPSITIKIVQEKLMPLLQKRLQYSKIL